MAGPTIATQLKAFADLTEKQIKRASARALNRAVTSLRVEATKKVRETINLKSSDIKAVMVLDKARAKESLKSQSATLVIRAKPVPLYAFKPTMRKVRTSRGVRMGVTVKVKDQRKLVKGGFVATVGAGHTGIFKRKGESRLPIKELYSTSVRDVFKDELLVRRLLDYGREQFAKNFDRELQYQLSRVQ